MHHTHGITPNSESSALEVVADPATSPLTEGGGDAPEPTAIARLLSGAAPDDLPFRLERSLLKIWGEPDPNGSLSELIDADGGIRDPLLCAQIDGDPDPKPVLYDGFTRLAIYFHRKAKGVNEAFPGFEVKSFATMTEVVKKVIAVQNSRRNVTPAQIAYAALEAKRLEGYAIEAKRQGRQKATEAKANQLALKPLPGAKALGEEIGVSDPIIRTVLKAYQYPDLLEKLISRDPSTQITATQAENKMEGYRRDQDVHSRAKTVKARRDKIAKMGAAPTPDAIVPNGIYTGDAVQLMDRIAPNSISFVCTSIPYPCNVVYDVAEGFDGDFPKYLDTYVRQPLLRIKNALESGGRVAINFDNTYRSIEKQSAKDRSAVPNHYNMVKEIGKIAEDELGLLMVGYKVWYKQNCPNYFSHGSRDCRTPVDNPNTEHVVIYGKDSVTLPCAELDSDITESEYDQFAVSHWYIAPQKRNATDKDEYHIVPYPEELVYRLVKLYCPVSGTVLDPFNGSGTTTFVAAALGRKWIGLDSSPLYNKSALERMATLDGLTDAEKLARVTRFVPVGRSDGFEPHRNLKPKVTAAVAPSNAA